MAKIPTKSSGKSPVLHDNGRGLVPRAKSGEGANPPKEGVVDGPDPAFTESRPKPVAIEFVREGMIHRLLRRVGMIAIYSVSGENGGREVVKFKLARPQKFPGGWAPWRESYPGNEEFGSRGWYFMPGDHTSAEAKFAQLVEEARK